MLASRSVNITLNLPCELADEVEHVLRNEPEFFEELLTYGIIRRAVFARLRGLRALHRPSTSPLEPPLESSLELA